MVSSIFEARNRLNEDLANEYFDTAHTLKTTLNNK